MFLNRGHSPAPTPASRSGHAGPKLKRQLHPTWKITRVPQGCRAMRSWFEFGKFPSRQNSHLSLRSEWPGSKALPILHRNDAAVRSCSGSRAISTVSLVATWKAEGSFEAGNVALKLRRGKRVRERPVILGRPYKGGIGAIIFLFWFKFVICSCGRCFTQREPGSIRGCELHQPSLPLQTSPSHCLQRRRRTNPRFYLLTASS